MTLSRTVGYSAVHSMTPSQQGGKVLGPGSKVGSGHTERVVYRILKDAKNLVGQEFCNLSRHACETVEEEVDRVPEVIIER